MLGVKKQVFLQSNRQAKFTPRAIARIMHGVGSPAFPNSIWSKTHFWYMIIIVLSKTKPCTYVRFS